MALATDLTTGEIQLTGDLAGDGGAQLGSNPQLTHIPGLTPGQYVNPKMTVDAKGRTSAIVQATPAEIGATLPPASASTLGVVSIGENLNITPNAVKGYQTVDFGGGIISGADPTGLDACAFYSVGVQLDGGTVYTVSAQGSDLSTYNDVVDEINQDTTGITASIVGGNIRITSDTLGRGSMIDVVSDTAFMCMTNYIGLDVPEDGTESCELFVNSASVSTPGVVRIGSGVNVSNGVISIPAATTTTLGNVIVPTSGNIDVDVSGNISIPLATPSTVGVVSVGSGLSVDGGVLSLDLPIATDTILGGVKEGAGTSISVDGTISVDQGQLNVATNIATGVVSVPGGDGLSVDGAGALTYTPSPATTTTLGSVIVPTSGNIDVDVSGNISIPQADDGIFGVTRSADTDVITITNGLIDVGSKVARTDTHNSFTSTQVVSPDVLTSGTSIAVNGNGSNIFTLTLGHNATLSNPTNLYPGATYMFTIAQDATGGRTMSYGTAYKFIGGVQPQISSGPLAVDIMSCLSDGTNLYCSYVRDFS